MTGCARGGARSQAARCLARQSRYSSVAERQSCKLKVLGSIPSGGLSLRCNRVWSCANRSAREDQNLAVWPHTRGLIAQLVRAFG